MKFLLVTLLALTTTAVMAADPDPMLEEGVKAFKAGDYATAKTLFEALVSVDPRNKTAQTYLRMIASKQQPQSLEGALSKVILSRVDLREVSAKEAVDFIGQQVGKASGGKQALNVVWMVPEGSVPTVTLALANVPATEALRYIAQSAGLSLSYDAYAVRIKPAAASSEGALNTEP